MHGMNTIIKFKTTSKSMAMHVAMRVYNDKVIEGGWEGGGQQDF